MCIGDSVLLDQIFCVKLHLVGQPELVVQDSIVFTFSDPSHAEKAVWVRAVMYSSQLVSSLFNSILFMGASYLIAPLESSALPSLPGSNLMFGSRNEGLPHHLGIQD